MSISFSGASPFQGQQFSGRSDGKEKSELPTSREEIDKAFADIVGPYAEERRISPPRKETRVDRTDNFHDIYEGGVSDGFKEDHADLYEPSCVLHRPRESDEA
jgi:hypothetical protein